MAKSRILQRIDGKNVVFHHGVGAWAVAINDDYTALLFPPCVPQWRWIARRYGSDSDLGAGDSILEAYVIAKANAEALRRGGKFTEAQLLEAAVALNLAYAAADDFDARAAAAMPVSDDEEPSDELGEVQKAALNRGRP